MLPHLRSILKWFFVFLSLGLSCGAGYLIAQPSSSAVFITEVKTHGNRFFSQREITRILNFQSKRYYSPQVVQSRLIELLEAYRSEGFYFSRVDSLQWLIDSDNNHHFCLHVYLHEGQRLKIREIHIAGNSVFSTPKILQWLQSSPSQPLRKAILEQDFQTILKTYANHGYPLCQVVLDSVVYEPSKEGAELFIKIVEGPLCRITKIFVSGNKITHTNVITRELRLKPGEPFVQRNFEQIPVQLKRLSFIQLVQPPVAEFDSTGAGVIKLQVEEKNAAMFNGVVGYTPNRKNRKGYFTGLIDWTFSNLLGTGRRFAAFWERKNVNSQELRLHYLEPWVLNFPIMAEIGFRQVVQDTLFIRRIWELGLQMRLFENITFVTKLAQEFVLPDSVGRTLFHIHKSRTFRFTLELSHDGRDDFWNPRQGTFYSTSVSFLRKNQQPLSPEEKKSSIHFQRIYLDLEYFCSLWRWQVVAIGLHAREVRYSKSIIPLEEQFRLGGTKTLRGYREEQFRGSRLAWINLEYRFLLGHEARVFLFLDSGYIFRPQIDAPDYETFKWGYGLGLRTKTNLGIIGLDYGLGERDNLLNGKIHLRLTNTF